MPSIFLQNICILVNELVKFHDTLVEDSIKVHFDYTGYKLVRQFSLPVESMRHFWLPLNVRDFLCSDC